MRQADKRGIHQKVNPSIESLENKTEQNKTGEQTTKQCMLDLVHVGFKGWNGRKSAMKRSKD